MVGEFIIKSIDTSMSIFDGSGVSISMELYPTGLDCSHKLHDACVDQKPIYFLTQQEYYELNEAKRLLETIKW